MRHCRASFLSALLAAGLVLTPAFAAAEEPGVTCRAVHAYFGPTTYLAPEDCPPWQGPGLPDVPLSCISVPVMGSLRGTWTFYWPTSGNAVDIKAEDHPDEILWPAGTYLQAYFGMAVYKTRLGHIYTRASGHTNSDAIPFSWPWATVETILGGTGHYEGASGWLGGGWDEANGGPLSGRICTPRRGPEGKGKGRK
jgi:hypothetical protein